MTNVMTRAWEIAKEGVSKFGGKVKEYFAVALKMAWEEIKMIVKEIEVELPEGSRKHKTWVAEIVGKCETYVLSRKFIDLYGKGTLRAKFAMLEEGKVYDTSNMLGYRAYVTVKNGEVVEMEYNEVKAMFA